MNGGGLPLAPSGPDGREPAEVEAIPRVTIPLLGGLLPVVVVLVAVLVGSRLVALNERSLIAAGRAHSTQFLNQEMMEIHAWLDAGRPPADLKNQLQTMALDSAVQSLAVLGADHIVLASNDTLAAGEPAAVLQGYDPVVAARALLGHGAIVVADEGPIVQEYMPVVVSTGTIADGSEPMLIYGALDLTSEFERLRAASWNSSARLLAVISASVLLLSVLLNETVIRRLRAVVGAMEGLSRGELASRSPVVGRDEIGAVGRAFNTMAERVQQQHEMLARSQARYQQVVEGSDDVVLVTTLLGRVLFINQASVRMFGLTPEECFGRSVYDFIAPEDLQATAEWAASVVAQHLERSNTEFRVLHRDGSRRYVLLNTRRVRDPVSGAEHFEHFVRDRTEVFNAEAERRASQMRFEAVFDGGRDAVLLADAELGRLFAVNRSAEALLGRSRDQLAGTSMEDVLPGIGAVIAQTVSAGAAGGAVEAELVGADGQRIPVEVSANVVALVGGQRVVQASCRDMRERRRMEEQVAHSERMSVIGQLAGGVAHDFNNQLAGILGYAELLTMRLPEGPLRSYAQRIEASAQHSAELTRKLLAFSRRGKYREQAVDMHAVLDDVTGILRHSIDPRIEVRLELDARTAWVTGDGSQLQSAVLNLGVNARDAMPDGGILTFRTSVASSTAPAAAPDPPSPRYLEIEVRDTGVGMDATTLAHAFEPFFTTKAVGAGTGLGLAAVYGTVAAHRGAIHLESTPGCGTSCRLWLPLADPPASTEDTEEKPETTRPGAHILVVDDEAPVRELLRETLESAGFVVKACGGGVEALEAWRSTSDPFDLVLLDLMMPGMNGAEFMAALLEIAPDARVLLLSGYADEKTTRQIVAAGAKGLLSKPCPRNTLLEAVQRVLAEAD